MTRLRLPDGFPAMTERVAFLMKDLVLFAVSFCLLKQDRARTRTSVKQLDGSGITGNKTSPGTCCEQVV
jgi:hypothetical protein